MDEVRIKPDERCDFCGELAQDGQRIMLFPIGGGSSWVHAGLVGSPTPHCASLCIDADGGPLTQSPEAVPAIAMVSA